MEEYYNLQSTKNLKESLTDNAVDDIFSKFGTNSVESLQDCIDDINQMIDSRQKLHDNIMKDMEAVEMDINNFLVKQQGDMPKEELVLFKEKSIELAESKRQELLACWRDISRLKEELRKNTREISERQNRMSVLDSILTK